MSIEGTNYFTASSESLLIPRARTTTDPLMAIIIPVYKQPQYLKDAVVSAVRQSIREQTKIIIVNDGCPYRSTDWLGKYFQDAFPGEVYYLKKSNGGVSSARNYGVRFALAMWPSIQAIFPLDADNKLSPTTLEKLWQKLSTSRPEVGWIYQDLNHFGADDTLWCTGIPFSIYRLLHENFCDVGSLMRRDIFDRGVWFDEELKDGYEDWEFFVNASLHGFKGVHISGTGFLYRKQAYSRNENAKIQHAALYDYIRRKHLEKLQYNDLILLEHEEMPRFAFVTVDTGKVVYGTYFPGPEAAESNVSAFVDDIVAQATISQPATRYLPPITLLASERFLSFLTALHLLPGLLFTLQKLLRSNDYVSVNLDQSAANYLMEVGGTGVTGVTELFAVTTRKLIELATMRKHHSNGSIIGDQGLAAETLGLSVGASFFQTEHAHLLTNLYNVMLEELVAMHSQLGGTQGERQAISPRPATSDAATRSDQPTLVNAVAEVLDQISVGFHRTNRSAYVQQRPSIYTNEEFAVWQHVDQDFTTFPYYASTRRDTRRPLNIWFASPWIGLGGVDSCVLNLARGLSNRNCAYRIHLVLTHEANKFEAHSEWLSAFDTITFLPSSGHGKHKTLLDILSGADVVINTHSQACYELLPELKRRSQAKYISYLHVTDLDKHGNPCGYPIIAATQYANLIDHFLVISHQLRRFCFNIGVPEEKVLVLPNAPAMSPPSLEKALQKARKKGRRRYSPKRPIRILFSGRFDYQKGFDRLGRVALQLQEMGVPFEFQVIGKAVISGSEVTLTIPGAKFLPATVENDVLTQAYVEADVVLLPSRWEGVPLVILEAMSFGNIVIATNVGAISEVIEDGKTGLLLDATQPEDSLVSTMTETIAKIVADPHKYDELRQEACRSAMGASWAQSAASLANLIDTTN
jgi:glycosyltransferase involved in cell wall biosynthesis